MSTNLPDDADTRSQAQDAPEGADQPAGSATASEAAASQAQSVAATTAVAAGLQHARHALDEKYESNMKRAKLAGWQALHIFSVSFIIAAVVAYIWLGSRLVAYLQPVLLPVIVAAIIAFLLHPLVSLLKRKFKRLGDLSAVSIVISAFLIAFALFALAVIPPVIKQSQELYGKRQQIWLAGAKFFDTTINNPNVAALINSHYQKLQQQEQTAEKPANVTQQEQTLTPSFDSQIPLPDVQTPIYQLHKIFDHYSQQLLTKAWQWLNSGGSMVFELLGNLFMLVTMPIFLFYFLLKAEDLKNNWHKYLPLRGSRFRNEVVATLSEINEYLIAFFRGQMLVSIIDGALTGIALMLLGLPYAFAIGCILAILGIVPYVGFVLSYIPTMLIAWVVWGDWQHLLYVSLIFFAVQQFDNIFIQPKIVGDSVGLSVVAVIFSMLFWTYLLGGVIGALLAIPLTAVLKVILRRYVWNVKFATDAA